MRRLGDLHREHGHRVAVHLHAVPAQPRRARSDFVADVLGEHVFEYFIRNKRKEWEEYRGQVTPFELKEYLAKL